MGATAPPEAVAALEPRVGPGAECVLLSDRRGSRAWKVTGEWATVVLKANSPEAGQERDKAAEIDQEDRHLRALTAAEAIDPGYRVDAGGWDGGHWLAVDWLAGEPLWHAFAQARGPEGDRPAARRWLLTVTRTWAARLARMHAAGWTHADVQPTNTVVTPEGRAAFFDFALSCGPDTADRLPYRGALTHTTAPEIADALLTTSADTHVQVRPPADVWGLGASLFWCWTGCRPVPYADEASRPDKLCAIAAGERADLAAVRPWPFPAFEEVIAACLTPSAAERPGAAEVARALDAVR
ncbi:hypothetical protein [Streptomyces sp. NPDC021224]|uniref:hypothetical protein n=1 Tax=unclassified Streptomyces TaxID=2593676 RepID=UPI0037AD82BB